MGQSLLGNQNQHLNLELEAVAQNKSGQQFRVLTMNRYCCLLISDMSILGLIIGLFFIVRYEGDALIPRSLLQIHPRHQGWGTPNF